MCFSVLLLHTFFLSLVTKIVMTSSGFTVQTGYSDCPCTHPLDCATLPAYGENPLDILLFGTHQPCPRWGEVRCCPRNPNPEFAEWMNSQDEKIRKSHIPSKNRKSNSRHLSRHSKIQGVGPIGHLIQVEPGYDATKGCGCIPKGICGNGTETKSCAGNFEVCCFAARLETVRPLAAPGSSRSIVRPSPVFKPKPPKCVEKRRCKIAYGINPYDISVYGSLRPCSDLQAILCLTEHENEMSEFQRYDQLNLTDPTFIRDVVRAAPVPGTGQASRNIEPVYRGQSEELNLDSLTDFSELKSIPPRIYVDQNGTLIISGGSPVIFLPTPVTLAPSTVETVASSSTLTPGVTTSATITFTTTSTIITSRSTTMAMTSAVTTTTLASTTTERPVGSKTLATVPPVTSKSTASTTTYSTSSPLPMSKFQFHHIRTKPSQEPTLSPSAVTTSTPSPSMEPAKDITATSFSEFEKRLNATMTRQFFPPPTIITAKTSISKGTASSSSSKFFKGNKVLAPRPEVIFKTTTTKDDASLNLLDVKTKPSYSIKTNESNMTSGTQAGSNQINGNGNSKSDFTGSFLIRQFVVNTTVDAANVASDVRLDTSLDIIRTISKFLLQSKETSVSLTNGEQKLNFSVARDKFLNLFGIFSDLDIDHHSQ